MFVNILIAKKTTGFYRHVYLQQGLRKKGGKTEYAYAANKSTLCKILQLLVNNLVQYETDPIPFALRSLVVYKFSCTGRI